MRCMATFDIGTTAVKAVLVTERGEALDSRSETIPTLTDGERREQDPRCWWEAFVALSHWMRARHPEADIAGIVLSGQMQDVIPVDDMLEPVRPAILYSDGRAVEEAEELQQRVGADRLSAITGNPCDGTLSLPKIMWLQKNEPEAYAKTRCFLISSKDYIIARLTGELVGDYTACSTAGAMALTERRWCQPILEAANISLDKLPRLCASHARVGTVTAAASIVSGYAAGTPVYAGVGDAGATTLASGIMKEGQYNINLGTSGWVATVSDKAMSCEGGLFNLAAMPEGKVINVVPFLNAGSVHRWIARLFSADDKPDYASVNALLEGSEPGSHGVFALPYLVGERFPLLDPDVRGTYVGITPETTPEDMARAMLEGVAFSIRQGMEQIGEARVSVSIIGGGGQVSPWCQMMADVLGQPVSVCPDAEMLPARAIASAAWIGEGVMPDYETFIHSLQADQAMKTYIPDAERVHHYQALYQRYCGLYDAMKGWYHAG